MKRLRTFGLAAVVAAVTLAASASEAWARGRGGGSYYQSYSRVVVVTPNYYVARYPTVYPTPYVYSYAQPYPQPVMHYGAMYMPMPW